MGPALLVVKKEIRMAGTGEKKPGALSIGVWISLAALVISLMGGGTVILSQFFAPKAVETDIAVIQEKQRTLDWKVETVRVEQQNASGQVQTINLNVVKLLERFRIEPEPTPAQLPLPAPPDPAVP
jgi:hypothetical protein